MVKVRRSTKTSCDAFKVSGRITLTSPTLVINQISGTLQAGDELPVFTGTGKISLTGTPEITPERPAPGLLWDTSRLASDGILAVVADPDGISELSPDTPSASSAITSVYDLNGRPVANPDAMPKGTVYIRDKQKVVK